MDEEYTPAQQEVIELLGSKPAERPRFDFALKHQLRATIEHHLEPLADAIADGDTLWVSKHALSTVHGCEVKWRADDAEPFAYSVPIARGTVAHKAIELAVHVRGDWAPADLVDEALARLGEGTDNLAEWLQGIDEVERAELRSEAVDRVSAFTETWPPLQSRWRPRTESRLRQELCDGRIVLSGKADLTVGVAEGDRAGKVIVDLKTGSFQPAHRDDLRFYALLDTLKVGIPPRLIANYYLDSGRIEPEEVTEAVLDTAAARTVDGVRAMVEVLSGDREPVHRPGPPCRWCVAQHDCGPGQAFLAEDREAGW